MDNFRSPKILIRERSKRRISILPRRSRKRMNFSIGCLFSLPRFFFNSFSFFFFCNSSSIVPRDRELSLKIRDRKRGSRANIFFQNFPQRKKKESRTMMVVRGKIARFYLFFFLFFSLFFNKSRNFLQIREDRRENACKRERRQEGSKKHAPFLPTTPCVSSDPRLSLGQLLLLLWMRIFNIFPSRLFIYIFFFFISIFILLFFSH